MRYLIGMLILISCANFAFAQEIVVERLSLPMEVVMEVQIPTNDPLVKDLQWNRWTSDNFVVCSINDQQAKYLVANLENIKKWIYTRWGFSNLEFPVECRIICVDDPELFTRFFKIDHSLVETRYTEEGKPNLMVIFYLLDDKPSVTVPAPLTEVCISNLDIHYGIKTPVWIKEGVKVLNGTLPSIRTHVAEINERALKDQPMYFSRNLLEMTQSQYDKLNEIDRRLFNNNAMAFCLYLRKTYGQSKFLQFYYHCGKGKNPAEGLKSVYGFQGFEHTDQVFKKFILSISDAYRSQSLQDSDLQI